MRAATEVSAEARREIGRRREAQPVGGGAERGQAPAAGGGGGGGGHSEQGEQQPRGGRWIGSPCRGGCMHGDLVAVHARRVHISVIGAWSVLARCVP
jgi:hypothetical protein